MGDNRQACLDHFRDVHGLRLPDQPQQTNIEKPQSVKVLLFVSYYLYFLFYGNKDLTLAPSSDTIFFGILLEF